MTREEYDSIFEHLYAEDTRYGSTEIGYKLIKKLWKQYCSLKQRIAELEDDNEKLNLEMANIQLKLHTGSYLKTLESPKTCEGCRKQGCMDGIHCYVACSRNHTIDYYEPKKDTE